MADSTVVAETQDSLERPPRPAQSAAAARVGGGVVGEEEDPRDVYAEHGKPFDTLRSLFSKLPKSVRMDAELALDQIARRVAADGTDAERWRACGKIAARVAPVAVATVNQCDGCRRGLPVRDGNHHDEHGPYMGCTATRYATPTPTPAVADAPRGDVRLLLDCKAALLGAVYSEDGLDGADADRLARRIDAALAAQPKPTGAAADARARAERGERMAEQATPGPWAGGYARECVHHPAPCPDGCPDSPRRMAVARSERNADGRHTTICEVEHDDSADGPNGRVQARRDAEFIAHARTAIPALAQDVRALAGQLAGAQEYGERMDALAETRHVELQAARARLAAAERGGEVARTRYADLCALGRKAICLDGRVHLAECEPLANALHAPTAWDAPSGAPLRARGEPAGEGGCVFAKRGEGPCEPGMCYANRALISDPCPGYTGAPQVAEVPHA